MKTRVIYLSQEELNKAAENYFYDSDCDTFRVEFDDVENTGYHEGIYKKYTWTQHFIQHDYPNRDYTSIILQNPQTHNTIILRSLMQGKYFTFTGEHGLDGFWIFDNLYKGANYAKVMAGFVRDIYESDTDRYYGDISESELQTIVNTALQEGSFTLLGTTYTVKWFDGIL